MKFLLFLLITLNLFIGFHGAIEPVSIFTGAFCLGILFSILMLEEIERNYDR